MRPGHIPELVRGSRVLFAASFAKYGGLFDPPGVVAEVVDRSGRVVLGLGEGVKRSTTGVYEVDLVVANAGMLTVTFRASTGEFVESVYEVVRSASAVDQADRSHLEASRRTFATPPIEAEDADPMRAELLADLAAAGIEVDPSRSMAYIEAAHASIRAAAEARGDTPRGRYLASLRGRTR